MCRTKKELEAMVTELRNLKAIKEEVENELKRTEKEIIEYMTANNIDTEITTDCKITYKPRSRTTIDKNKLIDILGDDLNPYMSTTYYHVLMVK